MHSQWTEYVVKILKGFKEESQWYELVQVIENHNNDTWVQVIEYK